MDEQIGVTVEAVESPEALLDRIINLPPSRFQAASAGLPPEMLEAATLAHQEVRQRRSDALKKLGKRLADTKLTPAVRAKRDIDARMAEDDRQYCGLDRGQIKGDRINARPAEDRKLPPGMNLTRSRANIWEARVINMACQGSALPARIRPSPKADIYGQAPAQMDQQLPQQSEADLRASRMDRLIRDQFAEARLTYRMRQAARPLTRYGTGIITGPEQRGAKPEFSAIQGTGVYEEVDSDGTVTTWRNVDPRFYFPEMVETETAEFAFEFMPVTKRNLRDMQKMEGFKDNEEAFTEILDHEYEETIKGEIAVNLAKWNATSPNKEITENRLALWRYVGYVEPEDVKDCGCDDYLEPSEGMVEMWMCDERVLCYRPLVPTGCRRIPYYVAKLFSVDDTPFGVGIPYIASEAQASINALWRATQHNASMSAGPQVGYVDGVAELANGGNELTGPALWKILDPDKKIGDVFSQFSFDNNGNQMLALLQMRIQMLDEEINLPLIAQGQPDKATPTAAGLQLQMRTASVAVLNIGQGLEDEWINPIINAQYRYNMLMHPDPSIKGDFHCVASLVSDNAQREIRATQLFTMMQFAGQFPEFSLRLKPEKFYPQVLAAMEQDLELLRTEQEVEQERQKQAASQPPDPKVMQIEIEKEKLATDSKLREEDRKLDHIERMRELDIREKEAMAQEFVARANSAAKLADIALREKMSLPELETRLEITRMKENSKVTIEAERLASDERKTAVETQVEDPVRLQ